MVHVAQELVAAALGGSPGGKRLNDLDPRARGSTPGLALGARSNVSLFIPSRPSVTAATVRLTQTSGWAKICWTRRQMDRTQKPFICEGSLHAEH